MAKKKINSNRNENSRLIAFLSYFLIGVIWYYLDKSIRKDKFVKFHVGQAIIFLVFWMVWSILLAIFNSVIPSGIISLLSLVPWIFVIVGALNVINGKREELPIIGGYAKNLDL